MLARSCRRKVILCPQTTDTIRPQLDAVLLWAAPHVLALYSQDVLHASAVILEGQALAFCGSSGAGKTTLAHQLARQGLALLSEDLVLLAWDGSVPQAVTCGESELRDWAAEESSTLASRGWIRTAEIQRALAGPRVPLCAVHFLHGERTAGDVLERATLGSAEALVLLLRNCFAELGQPAIWRRLLREGERLVQAVEMFTLKCPEGLDALKRSLMGYSWITKS